MDPAAPPCAGLFFCAQKKKENNVRKYNYVYNLTDKYREIHRKY